ncbi:unnamed protein product [Arctia plantaginis]|uniref:Uncharacterized protein n=1 Tax=Arctia plantaginis TaxID=874455 RepID=A0A8S1A442_ARCPL|nr:unnamed protein product [Arctia plantaginis]
MMNTLALLVGVLLCLTVASGRSFEEKLDSDSLTLSDLEPQVPKRHGQEIRHRKRRWQTSYGYDYPAPGPAYYPERRDYDRQDLLPKIVKLLEEISYNLRRPQPPPPPQPPIYIPYPVPYYVPQYLPCAPTSGKKPNVTSRFPDMEDTNQNWGFVMNQKDNVLPPGNGARPISFDPIRPPQAMLRPTPDVEHGSEQTDNQHTTQAPRFEHNSDSSGMLGRAPDMCNAAILSCCTGDQQSQRECFRNFSCGIIYGTDKICSPESINEALEAFKAAYSPVS